MARLLTIAAAVVVSVAVTLAVAHQTVEETGYLIDVETLEADIKKGAHGQYLRHPERYTIGQAKAAWKRQVDFTLLISDETEDEQPQQGSDLFGWQADRNPQKVREGHNDDAVPYRPKHDDGRKLHRRSHHTIPTAATMSTSSLQPVDRSAIGSYINARPLVHDNQGYLKVTIARRLAASGSEKRQQSHSRAFSAQSNVTSATFQVEGFLADIYCVKRVTALDGANMITNPKAHSMKCNLFSPCIPDGYTILTPPTSTSQTTYGPMYNLTADGNTKAIAWMRTQSGSQTNIIVSLTGKYASDGKFEIVGASGNTFGGTTATTTTSSSSAGVQATPTPSGDTETVASTSGAESHQFYVLVAAAILTIILALL